MKFVAELTIVMVLIIRDKESIKSWAMKYDVGLKRQVNMHPAAVIFWGRIRWSLKYRKLLV